MNDELRNSAEWNDEITWLLKKAFVANITFPKSLDELENYIHEGFYDIESLRRDEVFWTVPKYARSGDIVFFMHARSAIQYISRLFKELNKRKFDKISDKTLFLEWLNRGKDLYNKFGGKIFAVGRMCGDPFQYKPENAEITHWQTSTYAEISDIWMLQNPVDMSEFKDFLSISRFGSISPVRAASFDQLRALILSRNPDAPEYYTTAEVVLESPITNKDKSSFVEIDLIDWVKFAEKKDGSLVEGYHVVDGNIVDADGKTIPDGPIKWLSLSARPYNILSKAQKYLKDHDHETLMISDLLRLTPEKLGCIRNMGTGSVEEVIRQVGFYLEDPDLFSEIEIPEEELVFALYHEVMDQLIRDNVTGWGVRDKELKEIGISSRCLKRIVEAGYIKVSDLVGVKFIDFQEKTGFGKNIADKIDYVLTEYLEDCSEYGIPPDDVPLFLMRNKILSLLEGRELEGITEEMVEACFSDADKKVMDRALNQLVSEGIVIRENSLIRKVLRSFFQYAFTDAKQEKPKLKDIYLEVLRGRMMGVSLGKLGQSLNLTGERIRQIEKRTFNILTDGGTAIFAEDELAYLYSNYIVNRELLCDCFHQPQQTWYYLNTRYDKGKCDLEEALNDQRISVADRYKLEQYIHRTCANHLI